MLRGEHEMKLNGRVVTLSETLEPSTVCFPLTLAYLRHRVRQLEEECHSRLVRACCACHPAALCLLLSCCCLAMLV